MPTANRGRTDAGSGPTAPATRMEAVSVVLLAAAQTPPGPNAVAETLIRLEERIPEAEIVVVPVGRDDVVSAARDLAALDERLRVLKPASSWSAAIREGVRAARHSRVMLVGPHAHTILRAPGGLPGDAIASEVIACRSTRAAGGLVRRIVAALVELLLKLCGIGVHDAAGGVIVANRERLLGQTVDASSTFALTELLASARLEGLRVEERIHSASEEAATGVEAGPRDAPAYAADAARFLWRRVLFPGIADEAAPEPRAKFWSQLAVLALVAGLMLLRGLDAPLTEPDEARHAEIAREMWRSGDWIAPRFLGEPYLDKPPLLYWLCGLSFSLFGVEDWAARLVPALAAAATVLTTYVLGRRLIGDGPAWAGTLMLVLSLGFVTCGRFLILESVLTTCVVAGLLTGLLSLKSRRHAGRWWAASAVCCGLGVLAKGPVAVVIAAPPLAATAWLNGSRLDWRRWLTWLGLVAVIAAPWYVAVMIERPAFARYFFWEHNINRFLTGSNHAQPVWFYLPVLMACLLPWNLALLGLAAFLASGRAVDRRRRTPALGGLALWVVWELGFFSAAAGKLPYYILSCLPAVCLLMGDYLVRVQSIWSPGTAGAAAVVQRRLRRGTLCAVAAAVGVGPVVAGLRLLTVTEGLLLAGGWSVVLAVLWLVLPRLEARGLWRTYCTVASGGVVMLTQIVVPAWQMRHAVLTTEQIRQFDLSNREVPLACIDGLWGSIPFYTGRDDVEFLPDLNPKPLRRLLEAGGVARVLLHRDVALSRFAEALPDDIQMRTLLVTKRAKLLELSSTVEPAPNAAGLIARSLAGAATERAEPSRSGPSGPRE